MQDLEREVMRRLHDFNPGEARIAGGGGMCTWDEDICYVFYTVLLQMHARFVRFCQGRHLLNGFVGLLFRCEGGSE